MTSSIVTTKRNEPLQNAAVGWSKVRDYVELTKPRITAMVLVTVAIAALLSLAADFSGWLVLHVVIGVLFVSASGSAANQYVERYTDFVMPRTQHRPLPARRLSAREVALFASITFGIGMAYLAMLVNWLATALALTTWVLYVVIYTPLKARTWWNTPVGAVAGAMPVLIAGAATSGTITLSSAALFALLFWWQFPHFMAIAWMYRHEYAEGRLRMLTVVDPSGRSAGRLAVISCCILVGSSLLAALTAASWAGGLAFAATAAGLGTWYLAGSVQFAGRRDEPSARRLLRISVVYLPLVLLVLVLVQLI